MENIIGKTIKEKRIEQGLSQQTLAKLIGVTHASISYWENGVNIPNVLDVWKIADVLNISIDELIGRNYNGS
ncbi:MAG: helix-turn-helix transcriptional regulator [Clostridia bacterium]|nr:helix-turn-helix transcriptional regulator [Clostridia bacterium]